MIVCGMMWQWRYVKYDLGYLNQRLIEGKFLGDPVLDSLHFCQTNKYNELGWLILIILEKVGKEKEEF